MTGKRFRVHELVKYNYSEIGEYIDENHTDRPLMNNKVCELLNELANENEQLKKDSTVLILANQDYRKENEQLKQDNKILSDYRDWIIEDMLITNDEKARLHEENEQLKKDVEYWKQVASQYSNELNVWEHCKKYKTECKDIHWSSD